MRRSTSRPAARKGRILRDPEREPEQFLEAGKETLGLAQRHPEHRAGSVRPGSPQRLPPLARQPERTASRVQSVTSARDTRARLQTGQFVTRCFGFAGTISAGEWMRCAIHSVTHGARNLGIP